jgi:ABC-2 type transport system permease protein
MNQYFYLLGRGVAKLVIGLVSVLIVIGFGVIFFRLPLHCATIDWGLLLGSTLLGIVSIASLGIILGGITLLTARHFWGLGEAIGGALYLFTGAIFPLDVLPGWLRPIGFAFPVTYWLELCRRALLGPNALTNYQSLSAYPAEQLLAILAGFTVGLIALSVVGDRWLLKIAKERGLIDLESSY